MNTDDHALLRRELIRDEGLRYRAYRDTVGKLTAGVGRNLEDVDFTEQEIDLMLDNDIRRCVGDLSQLQWFSELDGVRQRACLNMRFNLGPKGFRTFAKFIDAMEQKDYKRAAYQLLNSKAAAQTGQRYVRLARMILTGSSHVEPS